MSTSETKPSALSVSPGSRNAGFVLGAKWHPSKAPAASPRHPAPAAPAVVPAGLELPVNRLEHAPAIFQGIITHYVEPELRPRLKESSDSLRLVEDLGLDSLSMVEVMMRVEDLLQIRVSDAELRHFRTLGEVRRFIDHTARGMSTSGNAALPAS